MNKKICILLPSLDSGGAERIRIVLAHEFRRLGFIVEFALMQAKGELLAEVKSSFSVHDLDCPRARELPMVLASYLRKRKPDALLAAMWPLTVIAPMAQRLSGHQCSVVISEHAQLSLQYRFWGKKHRILLRWSTCLGYRLSTACVAVSTGVALDISKLSGLPISRICVIHNPLTPRVAPSPLSLNYVEDLWQESSGPRILTVGRIKEQKNHALLVHAFSKLPRSDAHLVIVGQDGGSLGGLRQLVENLGISGRVTFAGFHHDPTAFYVTADLFVLSSSYEGFGNVILEALSQGLPVVSTDCPSGPSEILGCGRWGRLVPVGDVTALTSAMEESLRAPHDREALRRRAADFYPERAAFEYLKLMFPASPI